MTANHLGTCNISQEMSSPAAFRPHFQNIGPQVNSFSTSNVRQYMNIYICICPLPMHFFFKASHWPSDHKISSRPLIGQPSFPSLLVDCLGRALSTNSGEPYKRGVVQDCIHGSSTRGYSEESCQLTRMSPKNEELFRMKYMG